MGPGKDTHGTLGLGQRESRGWLVKIRQQIHGKHLSLDLSAGVFSLNPVSFVKKKETESGMDDWKANVNRGAAPGTFG